MLRLVRGMQRAGRAGLGVGLPERARPQAVASDTALYIACFSWVPVVLRTVGGEVAPASALAPKVGPMGLVRSYTARYEGWPPPRSHAQLEWGMACPATLAGYLWLHKTVS